MSVLIVAPIVDGADARAVRIGDDLLIQVSPQVPHHLHELIADGLRRAMRLEQCRDAVITLPAGRAAFVRLGAVPAQRTHSRSSLAAMRAAILMPLAAMAALAVSAVPLTPSTELPALAEPDPYLSPPAAPTLPAEDRDVVAAPVSIHPPKAIARATPAAVIAEPVVEARGAEGPQPATPRQADAPAERVRTMWRIDEIRTLNREAPSTREPCDEQPQPATQTSGQLERSA